MKARGERTKKTAYRVSADQCKDEPTDVEYCNVLLGTGEDIPEKENFKVHQSVSVTTWWHECVYKRKLMGNVKFDNVSKTSKREYSKGYNNNASRRTPLTARDGRAWKWKSAVGGLHQILRDWNVNGLEALINGSKNAKKAEKKSSFYDHQHGDYDVTWKQTIGADHSQWKVKCTIILV